MGSEPCDCNLTGEGINTRRGHYVDNIWADNIWAMLLRLGFGSGLRDGGLNGRLPTMVPGPFL